MNNKEYITPSTRVIFVNPGMMIALSGGEDGLRNGGSTNDAGITDAGVKEDYHYNVWEDAW